MLLSPLAILGAGNMASALALCLQNQKRLIRLYCIEPDVEQDLNQRHHNTKYLPGQTFKTNVVAEPSLSKTVENAETIFLAVPSFALHKILQEVIPFLARNTILANIVKGMDSGTLEPLIIREGKLLPTAIRKNLVTIGGPAVATEVSQGSPTGLVVAGANLKAAQRVQSLLQSKTIKVDVSNDVIGVSLASALKNSYAISLGMCDGLKLPTNTKAMVFTCAVQEMAELITKSGGKKETAYGLAGLGDLYVTGCSAFGRNRTYGEKLASATSKDLKNLGLTTVEGISATKTASRLAKHHHLQLPLLKTIQRCLAAEKDFSKPFVRYLMRH